MDIKKQFPKLKDILSEKEFNDLIYGYLQTLSDNEGLIPRNKIKATALGQLMGMSRQTAAKRLQYLFDMEFLIDRGEFIQVNELPENVVSMIPLSTLETLVNTMNEKTISVYVYLFNRYWAAGCRPFEVTYNQIKAWIGLSTGTRSNEAIVRDILFILQKIGLIGYEVTEFSKDWGKTVHRVEFVNLYLPDIEVDE